MWDKYGDYNNKDDFWNKYDLKIRKSRAVFSKNQNKKTNKIEKLSREPIEIRRSKRVILLIAISLVWLLIIDHHRIVGGTFKILSYKNYNEVFLIAITNNNGEKTQMAVRKEYCKFFKIKNTSYVKIDPDNTFIEFINIFGIIVIIIMFGLVHEI